MISHLRIKLTGIMLFCLLYCISSSAQLTGSFNIPGAPYATLESAITALNSSGVGAGGVTFNIAAGYTETFLSPTAGRITDTTGTVSNPIVFQKSGVGSNPLITSGTGTTAGSTGVDGIIVIAGGDYVTFDGIDVIDNPANVTTTTQMEWGYAMVKNRSSAPFNGCQYVAIKNCSVTLKKENVNTEGIHVYNTTVTGTYTSITATTDAHNNILIQNVNVKNTFSGIIFSGVIASSPYILYDQNNSVIGCTVTNFGGSGAVGSTGVKGGYQNNFTALSNTINNTDNGGTPHTANLNGIQIIGTTSNFTVRLNTISLKIAGTSGTYGVYNQGTGNIIISSNIFTNFQAAGSGGVTFIHTQNAGLSSFTADSNTIGNSSINTTANITCIANSQPTPNTYIRYNVISDISRISATTGNFMGYQNAGSPTLAGTETITNNSFFNISNNSTGSLTCITSAAQNGVQVKIIANNNIYALSNGNGSITGISCNYMNPNTANIYSNSIHTITGGTGTIQGIDCSSGPATSTTPANVYLNNIYSISGAGQIIGINCGLATTISNVYRNAVYTLSSTGPTSLSTPVIGIQAIAGNGNNIYKNSVYNLSAAGTIGAVYGISTAGKINYVYNNFVSDLKAPASSTTDTTVSIRGINASWISQGSYKALFNTVYLNAASTGENFGTAGLFLDYNNLRIPRFDTGTVELRNNIIVNNSTPSGIGSTIALRCKDSTKAFYSGLSNNNCFYAGTPGVSHYIYYSFNKLGLNDSVQTVGTFKSLVANVYLPDGSPAREGNSFTESVPFINTSSAPYDLHVKTDVSTGVESGGTPVTTPSITDDFEGDSRNVTTPDVGADEGTFTPVINIPSAGYPTLASAITALNAGTFGAVGITFNVAAGYTETFSSPTAGLITATGTVSNPIIFQKSGAGANPLITSGAGTSIVDGIIVIAGGDYITFDGIDVIDNPANATTTTQMEWGYALVKNAGPPVNGCQYVTIKNCTVTLNRTNTATAGVHVYNTTSVGGTVTPTSSTSAHNFNLIQNVSTTNSYYGIDFTGYNALSNPALYDSCNSVIGCTVTNFGGIVATGNVAAGIKSTSQSDFTANSNTVNNSANGGVPHLTSIYGIYNNTASNTNFTARYNAISLNKGKVNFTMTGVYNNAVGGSSNVITISSNTITNFVTDSVAANVYFIQNTGHCGTFNADSNIIGNSSLFTYASIIGIQTNTTTPTVNFRNNVISNITRLICTTGMITGISGGNATAVIEGTGTITNNSIHDIVNTSTTTGAITGISIGTAGPMTKIVANNNIYSISLGGGTFIGINPQGSSTTNPINVYSNNVYSISGAGTINGLQCGAFGTDLNIYQNTVHALSTTGNTSVNGISINNSDTVNCYKNSVYDLTSLGTTTTAAAVGISGYGTLNSVYNNFVSDLKVPASISTTGAIGIRCNGAGFVQTTRAYYNTVYLNAASTGANFGTVGIYGYSTLLSLELRNNIIVNNSTPAGTGVTAAFRSSDSVKAYYSGASNNNCFYAGTPGPRNFIYYAWNANGFNDSVQTIGAFKNLVANVWLPDGSPAREGNSFSENPPFINTALAPYNLHMEPNTPSLVSSGGTPVTVPNITDDFDGDVRNVTTPDVGADEYTAVDLTVNVTAMLEAFYNGTNMISDTVTVELRGTSSPYTLAESKKIVLSTAGAGSGIFHVPSNASYYIVIKHRNAIETWSAAGQPFSSSTMNYNFSSAQNMAYGNNMVLKGTKWCLFSGDVNQDGVVDLADMISIDNDNANFVTGYVITDVNGDQVTDLADMIVVDNNNAAFVGKITPAVLVSAKRVNYLKEKKTISGNQ